MKIQGKTALVTGASRGIGRAIALELAHQGAGCLILVARNRQRLNEVASEIATMGVRTVVLPLDLTATPAVRIAAAQVWQRDGPIHLLINCAGVAHQSPFLKACLPQVQQEIALNLMGTYTITHLLARRMARRREGRIINVSSLMGKIAAPTMATYSATKFALVGFTHALRGELAAYNVEVTALLPSLTETDMARDLHRFRWVIPTSPEAVARVLVASLDKESAEILVGWQSHLAVWCSRIAPGVLERVLRIAAPKAESLRFSSVGAAQI
jgi:3-oxoacyl-[acyl-carrier protein] reductase